MNICTNGIFSRFLVMHCNHQTSVCLIALQQFKKGTFNAERFQFGQQTLVSHSVECSGNVQCYSFGIQLFVENFAPLVGWDYRRSEDERPLRNPNCRSDNNLLCCKCSLRLYAGTLSITLLITDSGVTGLYFYTSYLTWRSNAMCHAFSEQVCQCSSVQCWRRRGLISSGPRVFDDSRDFNTISLFV